MLKIIGGPQQYCDGVSRRGFLQVGALGLGGLTLADLLRLEGTAAPGGPEATGTGPKRKRCFINIYLSGGPSHLDTFDLKPDAPQEIRGQFQGIPTAIPGYQICQHMPRLAKLMDHAVVVRSLDGLRNEHRANQSETGWDSQSLKSIGGRPSVGAVVGKLHGTIHGTAPTFVSLSNRTFHGFLGPVYQAYSPTGAGRGNLTLSGQMTANRLSNRKQLLDGIDRFRREADARGQMNAMDAFSERALTIITSGEIASALDLNQEDPRTRERYGETGSGNRRTDNQRLLLARRLIEAGVRCVSLNWGGWDTHGKNFQTLASQLPQLDLGLSSLIEDLVLRGMIDDVLIGLSGEFGRTPRINGGAGRDHWAKTGFFVLFGGGLRTGQVIGSTNRLGEVPHDRPVPLQEVFATIYHQLGIDLNRTTLVDPNGRPQYLVDVRRPMPEVV